MLWWVFSQGIISQFDRCFDRERYAFWKKKKMCGDVLLVKWLALPDPMLRIGSSIPTADADGKDIDTVCK